MRVALAADHAGAGLKAELLARLEGHLCRCCGYPKIVKAVMRAARQSRRK